MNRKHICAAIALAAATAVGSVAHAQHVTDGAFTTASEWDTSRPTVGSGVFGFDAGTNRGGAALYVEQSAQGAGGQHKFGDTLNLMYDYYDSPTALPGGTPANSSIDIFFEVPSDADYAIHITNAGFLAFEEPHGTVSAENPDGTLHFMNPDFSGFGQWTPLDAGDLANADFHTALGFGPSPNNLTPHLIAEFDLTIADPNDPAGNGLYSPDPSFWSAGGKSGQADPPISSEIFTLHADGGIETQQLLNLLGDPVAQPSDLPEPTTLLATVALGGLMMRRNRRK